MQIGQSAKDLAKAVVAPSTGAPERLMEDLIGTSAYGMSKDAFIKDVPVAIAMGAPLEAVLVSQDYREGKVKANRYVGEVAANAVSWAAWGLGGSVAGAAVLALGAPVFVAGIASLALGIVASSIWDRTGGLAMAAALEKVIPEKAVKPAVDGFVTHIANPIYDEAVNPLYKFCTEQTGLAAGLTAGALAVGGTIMALRFPAAGGRLLSGALRIASKTALGAVVAQQLHTHVVDKFLPETP